MASLSITLGEIKKNLAMILGIDRTVANWDSVLTEDVDRIIRAGRRKFVSANPKGWKFLEQHLVVLTVAPVTTGTVTIVDGVVTLAGSTFPTDLVDNYLFQPDGGGLYEISVRTDSTHATLKDTSLDAAALTTYTLYKYRYPFASNYGGFKGPLTTARNERLEEAAVLPDYELRALRSHLTVQTGRPRLFTVSRRMADEDVALPEWYLEIWPLADDVYEIQGDMRVHLGDALGETDSDIVCNMNFSQCMAEAIYAEGELSMLVLNGPHREAFNDELEKAIAIDKRMQGVRRLLPRDGIVRQTDGYEIASGESTWAEE